MNKDAYYFPHFSNARSDRKILRLRRELQIEGYGIYFMLLEVLRDTPNYKYPMDDIDLLAVEFNTSDQKVRTVICNYGLFEVDKNNNFFSVKFNEYLQPYLKMKEQRRLAGLASAAQRKLNDRSTTVQQSKVKESKEEESKVKKFKQPTKEELINYFTEIGYDEFTSMGKADKFFDYYESKGWVVGKTKMKDWKATCRNWKRNDNEKEQELKPTTKITL